MHAGVSSDEEARYLRYSFSRGDSETEIDTPMFLGEAQEELNDG